LDLAEEQLRVSELQADLLPELLEDSGAALAADAGGEGGSGGGVAGSLRGGGLLTRVGGTTGGTGLGLGLGSAGATTAGVAAAGLTIPGVALAGILDDDSNANPGELRDSPGETNVVTPNAEVSQRLERLLENGLGINRPSWLGGDDKINVEDPEPPETDPTEENEVTTDPTDPDRPTEGGDIRLANAADRQAGEEEVVNTDPTDSTRPTEGGDIRLANAAEQAAEDALPTQGGDIRLAAAADRQSSGNEARDRRENQASGEVEVTQEVEIRDRRDLDRKLEDKFRELKKELERQFL
jgi:hypothetical protein